VYKDTVLDMHTIKNTVRGVEGERESESDRER
jgi:hypothetical protein